MQQSAAQDMFVQYILLLYIFTQNDLGSGGKSHGDEESIKVAVRVRPFNKREANAKCCVEMNQNQTCLIDPNNPNKDSKVSTILIVFYR